METGSNIAAERVQVLHGDSRDVLKQFPDNHFDSVVTDPPYALVSIVKRFGKAGSAPAKGNAAYTRASAGFMGQQWDTGETAFDPEFWAEVLRVLKPGGHIAAFSGTRTYHRMAVAIEDAGFEIRDQLAWTYGSGFPKSHDVSKGIDKAAGVTRPVLAVGKAVKRMIPGADQNKDGWVKDNGREFVPRTTKPATDGAKRWEGWGTALKPAWEPICLGRKPLDGTVASNVLTHGAGALNISQCRVGDAGGSKTVVGNEKNTTIHAFGDGLVAQGGKIERPDGLGRWPANILHDGSPEAMGAFGQDETGDSPARFFYTAKADQDDRAGSKHPTVKPIDLMQWLVRLITPPGGLVLEPFAGSGTTGEAAFREGMRCMMIEREEGFVSDIKRRISLLLAGPEERSRSAIKAKIADGRLKDDAGPLFGGQPEIARGGADRFTATSPTRTNDWPDRTQKVSEA